VDRESLRLLLAQGESVERIAKRFGKHPSTVSYWMAKHGLEALGREKHAARGAISRGPLEALVRAGNTIAEIATEVDRSKATVRHWLGRYGLRTGNRVGRRPADPEAKAAGQLLVMRDCATHGSTAFVLDSEGCYGCRRCRAEAVTRRRRRVKLILVAEAGGCCAACGYDRHPAALQFHHPDPDQKRLVVSVSGFGLSLGTLRAEAQKCVLLCANCHAEVECGVRRLAIDSGKLGTPRQYTTIRGNSIGRVFGC
jgi:transposase